MITYICSSPFVFIFFDEIPILLFSLMDKCFSDSERTQFIFERLILVAADSRDLNQVLSSPSR